MQRDDGTRLEVLNAINNQCSIVQRNIAKDFGSFENESLIVELLMLHRLLSEYLDV